MASELSPARQALRDYAKEGSGAFQRFDATGREYWVDATRRDHAAKAFAAILAVLEVIEDEAETYVDCNCALDPGDHMVLALLDKLGAALKEALES